MFDFIGNNLSNLLVGALVFAGILAALWKIIRDKKKGKNTCGCNCADCPQRRTAYLPPTN